MIKRNRGLGDADLVAQTIQKIEGWFPGSLSYRNNNPDNLRPAGQPGCTPVNGFCSFPTYDDGYQALVRDLQAKANRGMTIQGAINVYAPASDSNDPVSYAAQLAAANGLSVQDPLLLAMQGSSGPSVSIPDELQGGSEPDLSLAYWGLALLGAGVLIAVVA